MAEAEFQAGFEKLQTITKEVSKVIVGQKSLLSRLLIGLIGDGHLLLEGVPGIAKTLAVNTFATALQLEFKRIQFTPDLLPADLIGTSIYNPKEGVFTVSKGPVFTNVVLADEINRAPPKVQSALLEVMQERHVTIYGTTFSVASPFIVLATQNPIEHEGTYPLPEAETDRFMMKVKIDYPSAEEEREIVVKNIGSEKAVPQPVASQEDVELLKRLCKEVYIDEKILTYIVNIVMATRNPAAWKLPIVGFLDFGASPRASIYLATAAKALAFISGRTYVTPFDVKEVAFDVLRHRLILSYTGLANDQTPESLITAILDHLPIP